MEEIIKTIVTELHVNNTGRWHKLNTSLLPYSGKLMLIREAISTLSEQGIIRADTSYVNLGGSEGGKPLTLENVEVLACLNGVKGIEYYNFNYGNKSENYSINASPDLSGNSGTIVFAQPIVSSRDSRDSTPTITTTQNINQKSTLTTIWEKIKAAFSIVLKWFSIAFIITFVEMWVRGIL